jgi:selenocysteine lyase/cysteine desulfurase
MSPGWVVWAKAPDRFEAGTPAIVNVIAFARALLLVRKYGVDIFRDLETEISSAEDILYRDELEHGTVPELLGELRKLLIGGGTVVPTLAGETMYVNLDNSASTQTFEPVWETYRRSLRLPVATRQEIVREVKSIVAGFLGASTNTYDVIFTSNTTEAINLAASAVAREKNEGVETVILGTLLEHSSNDLPWRNVTGDGMIRLAVDRNGFLDLTGMERILKSYNQDRMHGAKRIRIVTVSGASNVLGTCNDPGSISRLAHRYGALVLVDAAQLVAHRKIRMEECGIDLLAFSGHKVYAPFGCGALVARKGLPGFAGIAIEPMQSQGEENAAGIAALGKALLLLQRIGMDVIMAEEQALTAHALRGLAGIRGLTVYGINDPAAPGFSNRAGVIAFSLKGTMADKLAKELALQGGIGVRYGCHCAHILVKHILGVGPFLERFQKLFVTLFPGIPLPGVVRASLGAATTRADVERLLHVLEEIAGSRTKRSDKTGSRSENQKKTPTRAEVKRQTDQFTRDRIRLVYS